MKRLACALLIAGAVCLIAGCPVDALAAPTRSTGPLQLSIITPDPGSIADRISLDVSFKGSAIESVELYIDGTLVARRQLGMTQNRGVISFSLDANQLSQGAHDVVVKGYGADGKAASASTRLRIRGADNAAPVQIAFPSTGIQVSGIVPIRVFLESDLQRMKPYVTFFVDKELKVLRNFPPYEYAWDTTKETNGWHILEAWTQAPDAATPIRARPIHVTVNNAGGETKRQDTVPDLRPAGRKSTPPGLAGSLRPEPGSRSVDIESAASGAGKPTADTAKASGAPKSGQPAEIVISGSLNRAPQLQPRVDGKNARVNEPGVAGMGSVTGRGASDIAPVTRRGGTLAKPQARMMGPAATQPHSRMMMASVPKAILPPLGDPGEVIRVISPSKDAQTDTIRVQPGESLVSIARRTGMRPEEIAKLNNIKPGRKNSMPQTLVLPRGGAFQVAFNGAVIAFDVHPRVEKGVRLAPFRQIFEHTGGRLYWFGSEKTVRAVNSTREIEMRIGDSKATVNNDSLLMQRAPFLESGRTIVPLSFIRDSMDVNISFDEKTGRLLIESK